MAEELMWPGCYEGMNRWEALISCVGSDQASVLGGSSTLSSLREMQRDTLARSSRSLKSGRDTSWFCGEEACLMLCSQHREYERWGERSPCLHSLNKTPPSSQKSVGRWATTVSWVTLPIAVNTASMGTYGKIHSRILAFSKCLQGRIGVWHPFCLLHPHLTPDLCFWAHSLVGMVQS